VIERYKGPDDRPNLPIEWGGLNDTTLYFDETNTRMVMNFRNNYSRLAEALFQKGDTVKAIQTLDKCMMEFPRDVVNLSYFAIPIIDIYCKLGEDEKGKELLVIMIDDYLTEIKYLKEFDKGSGLKQNINIAGQVLGSLVRVLQIHKLEDSNYSYSTKDGKYYKHLLRDSNPVTITDTEIGDGIKVNYATYPINTFMDEYLTSIQ
jgi:hypothetical protein